MKPTDKAILGMVSKSSGRNASEPRGGLVRNNPKAEPPKVGRRQHGRSQTIEAAGHFGGVVGAARWQGHAEQLVKPSSPHRGNPAEQGTWYNRRNRESRGRRDGGG
jgi:hypothetical protein